MAYACSVVSLANLMVSRCAGSSYDDDVEYSTAPVSVWLDDVALATALKYTCR